MMKPQNSHSEPEQRSAEWFEQRKGRITASAVGAIMGLAPYATRNDVMRRMVREYHNEPKEFEGNAATEYGTFHEAGAIAEFEMETGLKVEPAPFVTHSDWLGASPDGYVSDGRLIEVKCPYGLRNGGEFKSIKDQMHYYAQIQLQLYVTGRNECYFYQWHQYGSMTEIVIRDHIFITDMISELEVFYDQYLDAISQSEEDLAHFLNDKTKKVHDSNELDDMMNQYQFYKADRDRIDEKMKELLSGMVALTDSKGGIIAGHTLYKTEKQGAISYSKAIKELLPNADLEPYRGKPSEYWSIK